MEDLKKIQEFFSKPLEETTFKIGQKVTYLGHPAVVTATKEHNGRNYVSVSYDKGKGKTKASDILTTDGSIKPLKEGGKWGYQEAETNVSDDIPDIIAVDVPLFIRLLEFAREDAGDDMDLHEVAERAIEAVKMRGVLSMDDYDTLVPPKKELDEKMLVPADKIDRMARDIAAKYFKTKTDKADAIEILRKAVEDSYRALDPEVEIKEEEGYSKFLKDDPNYPGGKTPGLTPDVLDRILMKIAQDVEETKQLGENLNEELCPKGKAYIKKRMAAGEKSSAYLSGRAVKVCKGQMEG
jgi:hypothetical protein